MLQIKKEAVKVIAQGLPTAEIAGLEATFKVISDGSEVVHVFCVLLASWERSLLHLRAGARRRDTVHC